MGKRLEGKVALITGAGNGMGEATARLFAAEGAKVVAVDIMEGSLDKWKDNENIISLYADITKEEDIEKMVSTAENEFGKLDIVCNIAGINDLCYTLEDTTDEMWDRVMDIDLKAPFRISKRAAKGMAERGSGVILNIGSYAAYRGNHGPSYTAAKHGVVGLTMSLAVGLISKGIRTNCINPGGTFTNIEEHSGGNYHPEGMDMLIDITGKFPTNGYAQPEDIANAALFLCSDEAKHINGAILPVDRGMSCC
jgi:NAD(P)-dependent dehydrogenase (short-subunit alcohol dehydrogenase family)